MGEDSATRDTRDVSCRVFAHPFRSRLVRTNEKEANMDRMGWLPRTGRGASPEWEGR